MRARHLVSTPHGSVHCVTYTPQDVTSGAFPAVCLHMSPRSVDEYFEVMPHLAEDAGKKRVVVAIDELGYGSSDNPLHSVTMDDLADTVLAVADHLGFKVFFLVGSLMGGAIALSITSRFPQRVAGLTITNPYFFPEEKRIQDQEKEAKRVPGSPYPDEWLVQPDGSHFLSVWKTRATWLSPELNTRCTIDDIIYRQKRKERYAHGVSIQPLSLWDYEGAARKTTCPVLLIRGKKCLDIFDMFGLKMTEQSRKVTGLFVGTKPEESELEDGTGNMINDAAEWWSQVVCGFLKRIDSA